LLPLALLFWWKRRQRWSLVVIALISLSAFVQIAEIAFHSADRSIAGASLGANPLTFARLFSGQVVVAALRGENRFALHASPVYACVVAAAGACVLLYCAVKANLELRLFICFATLLLFAALRSPAIAGPAAQWQLLELVPGGRYWFFPTLAFVWSLLWLAAQERVKVLRTIGVLALLVGCSGIRKDWRYPRFNDEHFAEYVHRFDVAPPGSSVAIPIYPEPLSFTLVKKR
jgi:hypothetical protein